MIGIYVNGQNFAGFYLSPAVKCPYYRLIGNCDLIGASQILHTLSKKFKVQRTLYRCLRGGFRAEQRPGWAELVCIHSLPQKWGRGYGSMMMEHLLQQMRAAGYGRAALWVFEQNGRARRFYEKNGFLLASERKDSFGAKEVLYTRCLEETGDTQPERRNA